MDRVKETAFIIKQLNRLNNNEIQNDEFIKDVCCYFDEIKKYKLNEFDFNFLRYISDKSGIPLYFDMLKNFDHKLDFSNINLQTFSSILYETTLCTDEKNSVHKYQKDVLDKFQKDQKNRFLLTASTSFGKTFLVYEIIRKMNYNNILLIFPSIALLSENFEKIITDSSYSFIKDGYKIFTLSEAEELGEKNVFIYTPERYLSFLEKDKIGVKFDFIFVDEIYKIDNDFEIDIEKKENERDSIYRLTSIFVSNANSDLLLAGPYINVQNNSFATYLREKEIVHIDYNNYEIVNKFIFQKQRGVFCCEGTSKEINLRGLKNKSNTVIELVRKLLADKENMILYSANRGKDQGVEYYAEKIINSISFTPHSEKFNDFLSHLKQAFSKDWIVYKALCKGVGIHHGLVPKYIQKEIIEFFNKGVISILISTTTITEGVNTSAKNLIVLQNKKGRTLLQPFDAKNIAGRAGRLGFHYSGNVFDVTREFASILEQNDAPLKHKNFDDCVDKNDIDLLYTDEKFLSANDKSRFNEVYRLQQERGIPKEILSMYKMVSWHDKICIYDSIEGLAQEKRKILDIFVEKNYQYYKFFSLDGAQIIIDIIEPIVKNDSLLGFIHKKDKNGTYSIISHYISNYLKKGFKGLIAFHRSKKSYDEAMHISTKFVFNILKYQIVKYFGAFNIMYKYIVSKEQKKSFDDVHGIDCLLRYFEYNAISDIGRKISDYGVPTKIIDYYEALEEQKGGEKKILNSFDKYEKDVYEKTKNLFVTRRDDE